MCLLLLAANIGSLKIMTSDVDNVYLNDNAIKNIHSGTSSE